jgi:hypothetical protein
MSHTIEAHFMGEKRTITLEIGKKYEVKPMNIAKGKDVSRTCTLLALNDDFMPTEAEVKWHDTDRKGKVKDLSDLILLED